jgi:hypothetical protein
MTATIMQAAGATLISIGAGLVFIPAGLIIAGVFAVAFGISLERNNVG